MNQREYDIVVYGATGFTGRLAASYLASHADMSGRNWAISGRNEQKLRAVQLEMAALGSKPELIVANSSDSGSIERMAASTAVVLTTVGPYTRYGSPVVKACVDNGADYVDITGETPWVRQMIDLYHERACAAGRRIVSFCGYDSVPSDIGCWMLVEAMRDRFDESCRHIQAAFVAKGGLNGGTVYSVLTMAELGDLRALGDVLLLNPSEHRSEAERERSVDLRRPIYETNLKRWLAPHPMAPVNTRVVRRSNALFAADGDAYGERFSYNEGLKVKSRVAAHINAAGYGAFATLVRYKATRKLIGMLAPEPGSGPSEAVRKAGFINVDFVATSDGGQKLFGEFSCQGDPANTATVLMLCESALCLVVDRELLPQRAGILTPATAFGGVLLERLRSAGVKATVSTPN